MAEVMAALCPPCTNPGTGWVELGGSCRAFVQVHQQSMSAGHVPVAVRRLAGVAYAAGAVRVEYMNEEMDRAGLGPRRLARPV